MASGCERGILTGLETCRTQNELILQWTMTAQAHMSPEPASASENRPGNRPAADVKTAHGWLHTARFLTEAPQLHHLPALDVPEIAFVGRSNAGKSTSINTLTQQKRLAFASKTPGRTQSINLFALGKQGTTDAVLADLPGYGYAEVSGSAKDHWQDLLGRYVQVRDPLVALVLIMDARRPFTELDIQMLEWFAGTGKPIHCLLSKADKLNRSESADALRLAHTVLSSYVDESGTPLPFTVQLFSATKRIGVDEADAKIRDLLGLNEAAGNDAAPPEEENA